MEMGGARGDDATPSVSYVPDMQQDAEAMLAEALEKGAQEADPDEVADADARLDELMNQVAEPADESRTSARDGTVATEQLTAVSMRTATPLLVTGRTVALNVRGIADEVVAELEPGVSPELVSMAVRNGDAVVVEYAANAPPLVVGILQRRIPETLHLKADKVHIEGESEVLVRSSQGALRIRQDGDVELAGRRLSAMSRGLFRLVGRVLRLN